MIELLFSLLASGAKLVASNAVGEFAKGGGKSAFDALKARLSDEHGLKSLALLEDAPDNPAFADAIKSDLSKPGIAEDSNLVELAAQLRDAIATLPPDTQSLYAINIDEIHAGGTLFFDAVEGVRAKKVHSKGDMTFRNIDAPPGK